MSGLAAFQEQFARALLDAEAPPGDAVRALCVQPGIAVYRNTVFKACIDALQASYPGVARLVGEEWFRAAAAEFVRANPPRVPMLHEYGEEFPAFVAGLESARELPYLYAVARLDWLWAQCHAARGGEALGAARIAALATADLGDLRLRPHAAARWAWFDEVPARTIWSRNRIADAGEARDMLWRGEGVLLTRPAAAVEWRALERAECRFLDACAEGRMLSEAAAAALQGDPTVDLSAAMARFLDAGAFAAEPGTELAP